MPLRENYEIRFASLWSYVGVSLWIRPETDIPPLDLIRRDITGDIIRRRGYLAVHCSASHKKLSRTPHYMNSPCSARYLAAKNLYQSFYLSPPFRPGYLSAPKDSRKVRAQLRTQGTTKYTSQGTDRDPVSYLVQPVQRINLAPVITHYLIPLSFSIRLFCPPLTTQAIMFPSGFALKRDEIK